MPWQPVQFKGKQVWAEVDAEGRLVSRGGRVPLRYSDRAGAKVYGAGAAGVERIAGAASVELPEGVSADEAPARGGARTGGARAGGARGSGFGSAGRRSEAQAAAARRYSRQQIEALPAGTHLAFTDGACQGNPGPAGAGAVVKLADGRVLEASQSLGVATNNVGELTAIGMALGLLDEAEVPPEARVVVFTDSDYARGVLVGGWKARANQALIARVKEALARRPGVEVCWIAGHVGIPENERADFLAGMGARGQRVSARLSR